MKSIIFGGAAGIGKAIDDLLTYGPSSDPDPIIIDKTVITNIGRFIHSTFPLSQGRAAELDERLFAATDGLSFTHIFITLGVPSHRKFDETSAGKEVTLLQDNFRAVTSALRFAKPRMLHDGSFVVISSVSASQADPGGAIYSAAKAGIEGLVRGLAREWMPMRVNAIAPGPTATDQFLKNVPAVNQRIEALRSPHNRLILPSEIADAAVGLAQMTGVSGVVLPVDLAGLSSSRRADD